MCDLGCHGPPVCPWRLRGVEKNKAIIIVTPLAYVLSLLTRISPTAAMWWWRRVFLSRVRALRRPDA